jgi:hypothetical protein
MANPIIFSLRPSCDTPSPFNGNNIGSSICGELKNNPYQHAVVSGDGGHDEVLPIPDLNTKGSSSGGKSYEDNMMVNSLNFDKIKMEDILNTYGTKLKIPNDKDKTNYKPLELNEDICNIVDVFSGSHFCPGYNNYIDCAEKSYKNFIDTLGLKNPLKEKDPGDVLLKQNDKIFKFSAILNYDILLYAYFLSTTPTPPQLDGVTNIEKTIQMNISVMNILWENLLTETQAAIDGDHILQLNVNASTTWRDCYTSAITLLKKIKFNSIEKKDGNINYMNWSVDGGVKYPWGITQGTSATSILQVLKQIVAKINCCIPRNAGGSKKTDKTNCSKGLNELIKVFATDATNKNNIAASLHAICKFIGDTSHITFGNLIQNAKDAPNISEKVKLVYDIFGYTGEQSDIEKIKTNIEKIKINFWVAERPMATRLCLDKQIAREYSVGIHNNTGQIIKKLFHQPIEDDEYLSVNFDTLAYSKSILDNLNEMFDDISKSFPDLKNDALNTELTGLNGTKTNILTATKEEQTTFNTGVKDFNKKLDDLINTYKIRKIEKNVKEALDKNINMEKFINILEMGGTRGVLTKPVTDLRKIPKQTSAQGWMELKKEVKKGKDIKDQYDFLTNIISLLLDYCSLKDTDISAVKANVEIKKSDLYWLIKNLGNLYVKHSTNVHNIIVNSIEQVAKESESSADFYLYISNLFENIVKLNLIFDNNVFVGGAKNKKEVFIQELMVRGLGTADLEIPYENQKLLKTYVLSLLERNVPIYMDERNDTGEIIVPKSTVWDTYTSDKKYLLEGLKINGFQSGSPCFFGPFYIPLNETKIQEVDESKIINEIIDTVVEFDTLLVLQEDEDAVSDADEKPDPDPVLNKKTRFIYSKIFNDDQNNYAEVLQNNYNARIKFNSYVYESLQKVNEADESGDVPMDIVDMPIDKFWVEYNKVMNKYDDEVDDAIQANIIKRYNALQKEAIQKEAMQSTSMQNASMQSTSMDIDSPPDVSEEYVPTALISEVPSIAYSKRNKRDYDEADDAVPGYEAPLKRQRVNGGKKSRKGKHTRKYKNKRNKKTVNRNKKHKLHKTVKNKRGKKHKTHKHL